MPNEKMENLLNLALAATQEEREKSLELDIGYDSAEQTWEVIVKFVGTTEELEALLFKNFPEEYPRTPCRILFGTRGWLPTTIMTAIVSPSARPTPRMTAARIPDFAAGTTTVKTLRSCVAPSASAPS